MYDSLAGQLIVEGPALISTWIAGCLGRNPSEDSGVVYWKLSLLCFCSGGLVLQRWLVAAFDNGRADVDTSQPEATAAPGRMRDSASARIISAVLLVWGGVNVQCKLNRRTWDVEGERYVPAELITWNREHVRTASLQLPLRYNYMYSTCTCMQCCVGIRTVELDYKLMPHHPD